MLLWLEHCRHSFDHAFPEPVGDKPTSDPSQEGGTGHAVLLPSWERLGVGSWSQRIRKNERRLSANLISCTIRLSWGDLQLQ